MRATKCAAAARAEYNQLFPLGTAVERHLADPEGVPDTDGKLLTRSCMDTGWAEALIILVDLRARIAWPVKMCASPEGIVELRDRSLILL